MVDEGLALTVRSYLCTLKDCSFTSPTFLDAVRNFYWLRGSIMLWFVLVFLMFIRLG